MTDLDELKYHFYKNRIQIAVLDARGFVAYSCNTLFDFERYKAISTIDDIPLLESIWEEVLELRGTDNEISITRLELELQGKQGYYDYYFSSYEDDPKLISWFMVDQTETYSAFRSLIQQRNEMYIKRNINS